MQNCRAAVSAHRPPPAPQCLFVFNSSLNGQSTNIVKLKLHVHLPDHILARIAVHLPIDSRMHLRSFGDRLRRATDAAWPRCASLSIVHRRLTLPNTAHRCTVVFIGVCALLAALALFAHPKHDLSTTTCYIDAGLTFALQFIRRPSSTADHECTVTLHGDVPPIAPHRMRFVGERQLNDALQALLTSPHVTRTFARSPTRPSRAIIIARSPVSQSSVQAMSPST